MTEREHNEPMANDFPPGHPAGNDDFVSVGEVTSGHGLGTGGVLGTHARTTGEPTRPANASTTATVPAAPTVLIAVESDLTSERVVRTAHSLFGEDATYFAINVSRGPYTMNWAYLLPAGDVGGTGADTAMARAAAHAEAVTHDAGLAQSTPIGDVGDPTSAIIRAAHHHHADVVVIGADARSWLSHLLEGSVERGLLREADFAVLVVAADRPIERT